MRAQKPLAPRKADRVHTLNLTGEMAGYVWSINNVVWNADVPPLPVAGGERVELVFVNQTPMPHPMHLHGHEFQVVEIDGERFSGAVRDTVLVTPGPPGGRGVRRQQSGLVGAPLPPALPPRRRHVHDDQVRVTASGLAAGSPHPVLRTTFSPREKGQRHYPGGVLSLPGQTSSAGAARASRERDRAIAATAECRRPKA